MDRIRIKNLTKRYGERVVVDGLNLEISEGEFFGLLGSNGAGKTTTIKMLCCLVMPDGGDALLMGKSVVNDSDQVKKIINLSPQETAIAPKLTVKENLEMIARLYGSTKGQARQQAKNTMNDMNLTDRQNDKAGTLSGGLQRKLSIGMALITNPRILFLDEPTLGLDVRARRELWRFIERLKGKVTLVLTTHYLEEAEALADRICIMDRGKIQALGTAAEIVGKSGQENFEEAFIMYTGGER